MKIPGLLKNCQDVVIDTNVFIYLFEDDPHFGEAAERVIKACEQDIFSAVITPITIAELLVKPLKMKRNDLADRCRSILRRLVNIRPVDLSYQTAQIAGALRAKYNLSLPDMLQVAVAIQSQTPTLITNDRALSIVTEAQVLSLTTFL